MNRIKDIRNVIEGLEKQGLEEQTIVRTLIHSAVNRKLEITEVEYIHTYINGLPVEPVNELRTCRPCPGINDLIYRLLELPSEAEVDDYISNELKNINSGPERATIRGSIKNFYRFMVGKLDKDEKPN